MKAAERGVGAPPPGLTHGKEETHAEGCGHSTQAISLFHMITRLLDIAAALVAAVVLIVIVAVVAAR
jgi:hypothetical protein